MKRTKTATSTRTLRTRDLSSITGGTYYRSNVLGEFGKQLDSRGDLDLVPSAPTHHIDLDSHKEWVGTKA